MAMFWQAVVLCGMMGAILNAEDFSWEPLKVQKSVFTQELGMLDPERDDYATNLAIYAASQISAAEASETSLESSRRFLALALHLSPRNKRAVVLNFQLSRGILPVAGDANYSPQVFARLLLTRGQLLEKQGGKDNATAARAFIHLAAMIDPKNEDAVYASEMQRIDLGELDWKIFTEPPQP